MDVVTLVKKIIDIEVKPSAGCTEIASVGYAVALAKEKTKEPYRIELYLDYDTFKNAVSVGVPGKGFGLIDGIKRALVAKPRGLETFLTTQFKYNKNFEARIEPVDVPFLLVYTIVNDNSVLIVNKHDSVVYFGAPISLKEAIKLVKMQTSKDLLKLIYDKENDEVLIKYKEVVNSLDDLLPYTQGKIRKGIELSINLSKENLSSNKYFGIARTLPEKTIEEKMIKYTAAAVEARMSGSRVPAMAVAGSGNQGITTTVPLAIYARENNIEEEKLYKAILLAWLTTIYATAFTRYVSPVCGSGIKAGVGLAAGFGYLLGGNYKTIVGSIINHLASITGIICDGAKPACSLKVASSIQTVYRSAMLASRGIVVKPIEGLVDSTVEETLRNVGKYVDSISKITNDVIVEIINKKLLKY